MEVKQTNRWLVGYGGIDILSATLIGVSRMNRTMVDDIAGALMS